MSKLRVSRRANARLVSRLASQRRDARLSHPPELHAAKLNRHDGLWCKVQNLKFARKCQFKENVILYKTWGFEVLVKSRPHSAAADRAQKKNEPRHDELLVLRRGRMDHRVG